MSPSRRTERASSSVWSSPLVAAVASVISPPSLECGGCGALFNNRSVNVKAPRANRPPMYRGPAMSDLPDDFQNAHLAEVDPDIARILDGELGRQQGTLEMIASENFVPQAV